MPKRPTIADLAEASGVSVATVDRVLNGRLPVREETARRVYDAANAIGYHAAGLIRQRMSAPQRQHRLGFLFQKPEQAFYRDFAREIELAAARAPGFSARIAIDYWSEQRPEDIVARLNRMAEKTEAVALVSPDHPTITAAVEALKAHGIPVFSLLSDFAPGVREGYVGLNNRKAGRTAAWMIARAAPMPGKIAVFVGSHRFHGHELREIGLRSYFREHAPDFTVLETLVNLETADLTHQAMLDLIAQHQDLVGCYVAGGGMEGAISALRQARPTPSPAVVCHESTGDSRAALADNIVTMVIATPLTRLCAETIELMGRAIEDGAAATPGQTFLPFDIVLPESI